MPKKIDDIVFGKDLPAGRRGKSIRDIPLPESRRKTPSKKDKEMDEIDVPIVADSTPPPHRSPRRKRGMPRGKAWLAITAVALVVLFLVLSLFAGATLAYTPKSAQLSFANDIYTANKTGEGGLLYSVVKLSGEKGATVPATGEEDVSRKSSGTIIVYNKGGAAQPLVENTRFQTPEGKVYRISRAINIPAGGSVEATVYADQPGESHNIGLSDFTLPGLKGTAKFESVYARSKTAMTGGFVGKAKAVSPEELAKAKMQLQAELREELATQVRAQVPADFVLFSSLAAVTFEDLPQGEGQGSSAIVNMRGNYYGVMFKKNDLSAYLASRKAELSAGDLVEMPEVENLDISFNGNPPSDLLNSNQISFVVNGSATLLWKTDEDTLKSEIAGRHKSEIPTILSNYPSISTAEAMIRPFWKSSFPEDPAKVSIKRLSAK